MTTPDQDAIAVPATAPRTEGHPRGLYVLFFTEMWERFSYYGMRALLMLYMVNYFKWSQQQSSTIYKWYTGLVYLTPMAGGFVADYWNRQGKTGNKRAVVIGAILMAIGHFLMAIDNVSMFLAALGFLILGNGMFKPNMSVQVGRLYPQNDARRDSAYTIFYMGINLGAFLSPLVCGELHERYSFHYGFGAAGVGMLLGLFIYLGGLRWVKEVSGGHVPEQKEKPATLPQETAPAAVVVEAEDSPPRYPTFSRIAPTIVFVLGGLLAVGAVGAYLTKRIGFFDMVFVFIAVVAYVVAGAILSRVQGAARERVMAIYILGVFVVLFWLSFEQAGNVMNIWADQSTQRYLTDVAPTLSALPQVAPPVGFPVDPATAAVARRALNPVPTEWFQSINALAIFALGLVFTFLWTWLDRRGRNPSIPTKMAIGLVLMTAASGLMFLSARAEDRPTQTPLASLPAQMVPGADGPLAYRDAPSLGKDVDDKLVKAQFGRLFWKDGTLSMRGVLADVERDRILRATVPPSFIAKATELARKADAEKGDKFAVSVVLDEIPPGFDLRYAGFDPRNLHFDAATRTLTLENMRLADKDYKAVLVAASEPALRDSLNQLYIKSAAHKVSAWWLFFYYVICTLSELCISPVGLSMVSKLAPARFATMLMGMWLLTSFFGNFIAGQLGEAWGTMAPTSYFLMLIVLTGIGSVVLFLLLRKPAETMMHGVK